MLVCEVAKAILSGENVAFVGVAGSGKTTALRKCLHMINPMYGIISHPSREFAEFKNILMLSEEQGFSQTCPAWIHIVPETREGATDSASKALCNSGSLMTTIHVRNPEAGEDIVQLFYQRCNQLGIDGSKFSRLVWTRLEDSKREIKQYLL